MPHPGVQRQRRQRQAASQWRRRSQLGDPCPLSTLGVMQDAHPTRARHSGFCETSVQFFGFKKLWFSKH
jgi:hypothetical protein